jgi:hypothetical protein
VPSVDEGLNARGFAGVRGDLARRLPTYGGDWTDGLHPKAAGAIGFLFFACLAPAIAFGGLMSVMTGGEIGVVEMIVSTAACGVAYAVVAGQPLTILGGTGPLLVFTAILYDACRRFGVAFLPTYAWIGLWSGLFTVVLGATGMSRLVARLTRFTDETFAALISVIFVYQAIANVLGAFPGTRVADDSALFGLVLAAGTYMLARSLAQLRHRPYLRRALRELIADFGPATAVLAMVFARRLLPAVRVEPLAVPAAFGTSTGRAWLVPLGGVPPWVPVVAIVPALLVALLVFMDQNVTVRIIQSPSNALKKGSAYHWDLVVVGALLAACSMLGLPWLVAATVRSVNHVRALSSTEGAAERARITGVRENRVSPLLVHAGIGASLLATKYLVQIPMPVLYGLFFYMGLASTSGNQFFDRLRLWLTDPALYPPHHYVRRVPPRVIHAYTALQAVCLGVLWAVKSSAVGILFPLVIALLVPVRSLMGRWISAEHLGALDADESPDDVEDHVAGP